MCKHHTFGQGVGKKTRRTFSLDFCNLGQRGERSKQVTCFFMSTKLVRIFLSFKQLSYLLIKWKWLYIFAIDYKLNLRLVKLMVIRTGGEVFGIGNPVAGAAGVGGDLDAQGKKSCHPFGSQDDWSIVPYSFSTFAFSGRLLLANFLLLCPVIIFAKMGYSRKIHPPPPRRDGWHAWNSRGRGVEGSGNPGRMGGLDLNILLRGSFLTATLIF